MKAFGTSFSFCHRVSNAVSNGAACLIFVPSPSLSSWFFYILFVADWCFELCPFSLSSSHSETFTTLLKSFLLKPWNQ